MPDETVSPTILEWAGGEAVSARWLDVFYDLVEAEPQLAPLFGGTVGPAHRTAAAAWWCEVMGGPETYTREHGGYERMLAHHRGLQITLEQRRRFVALLAEAADLAELPADPELRAALMGYAEWGTWLAVNNSAADTEVVPRAPVPRWGWGVAPPYQG